MKGINPYKLRIPFDRVLVKMTPLNEKIIFSNGTELYIDTSYNPAFHANVIVEVVAVPERFSNPTELTAARGVEWKPELDVSPGDTVIADYHECMMNFGRKIHRGLESSNNTYLEWEGSLFVFINYHSLFAKIVNDQVVPLNGYVVYSGIYNETGFGAFTKKKLSDREGVAVAVGVKNVSYLSSRNKDGKAWLFDIDHILPGDRIYFKKGMYRKLEYDSHATQDKNLYLVQRRYVYAIAG